MGQRRMFSNRIANSAKFLQMPTESQLLYFHMILRADDDGIVESYPLIKMLGVPEDNFKVLAAKGFIKQLNSDQVVVITDWLEHNVIRADRKVDSIYIHLLREKAPELPIIEPKPRSDVDDNSRRLSGGQSTDGISQVKLSKDKLKNTRVDVDLIKYFFELKGWEYKEGDKQSQIVFRRYLKSAGDLLILCDNNLSEAKECLKKVSDLAKDRELEWSIETVFKKWYDIDLLKPKEKKPHYDNCRIFQKVKDGRWFIIRGGEIKELGYEPREKEIVWK